MPNVYQGRNLNLDIMRLLGIIIIIMAHSSPPGWLFQLRNFGTPLLIIASGLTYSYLYSNRKLDIISFYKKRLSKLIFPAWIFISIFFFISYVVSTVNNIIFPFSIETIISTYSFYEGIGFLWIFKVYIFLALITPISLIINRLIKSDFLYFILLLGLYGLYELMKMTLTPWLSPSVILFFNQTIFIILPFSILYLYGFRLSKLSDNQLISVVFLSLSIFVFLAVSKYLALGQIVSTQTEKYPPSLYYLSYAFFAINLLYFFVRKIPYIKKTTSELITWLSASALWIYLWHILAYYIWLFVLGETVGMFHFIMKFVFLVFFGTLITFFQQKIVMMLFSNENSLGRKVIFLLT